MASILPFAIADEAPVRRNTLLWTAALVPALACYCLAHDLLSRHPSVSMEPILWSIATVLPWAVAFEAIQRLRGSARLTGHGRDAAVLAILLATYLIAIVEMRGFKLTLFAERTEWAREALLRLPYLVGLVAVLAATGAIQRWRHAALVSRRDPDLAEAPVLPPPGEVLWVRAAGNYVEFGVGGRTLLYRATLQSIERQFAAADFIRVHRSTIVNGGAVERAETASGRRYVVTSDGRRHPVSAAYRGRIRA